MDKPIFIFSQGRAGSTLLQRVLNSLDDVIIYGEHIGFLKGAAESYHDFMRRRGHHFCSENANHAEVQCASLRELKDPKFFAANSNGLSYEFFKDEHRRFVKTLIHTIPDSRFKWWGFKEIRYDSRDKVFPMLAELFPQATFIFLVRHPLQQIASWEGVGWWNAELEKKIERWSIQATSFLRYHSEIPDRSVIVKYEEFTDPNIGGAKKLFDRLGFSFSARQEQVIFGMEKVGGAPTKPVFDTATEERIRKICLTPETAPLYAS